MRDFDAIVIGSGAGGLAPGIHGVSKSGLGAAAAALGCEPEQLLTATGRAVRVFPAEDPSCWPETLRREPRA